MTIKSAYNQVEMRGYSTGICFPSAIDAMLPISELPDEYYDLWAESYADPNSSYNTTISHTLKNFFKVEPMGETDTAAIAKFNAFGASPQPYMPDVSYDFPDTIEYFTKAGVTPQQMRFVKLLEVARNNECNILFTNNNVNYGEHVSGLQMIDPGDDPSGALYVVRDYAEIQGRSLYTPNMLAGIPQTLGNADVTDFTPLPTVQRSYFPDSQSSWELIMLPPDPSYK